jgi:hypothetical protein
MTEKDSTSQNALTFWAVIAGGVFAALVSVALARDAHSTLLIAAMVAAGVFAALSGIALLSLSDPASRGFMAGTLRKSTYTQIYTTLTRRQVTALWNRLCDPVAEKAGIIPLFRAALTWRLYDTALLIAVAYPILLPVGQWVVTGAAARIGGFELLPAAGFWWDRAAMCLAVGVVTLGFFLPALGRALSGGRFRERIVWAQLGAFIIAMFLAGGQLGTGGGLIVAAIAVAALLIGTSTARVSYARWLVAVAFIAFPIALMLGSEHGEDRPDIVGIYLFLGLLPLLNALFDTVSYAVTLTLMRRGLRSAMPWLWGLLDLSLACLLFLALGGTLVVVIHALNGLAGVPLIDLPGLFAGVRAAPGEYVWLYLMLFSTILPTVLHAGLSLLGVQGLWPRGPRRVVAGWIEAAPKNPLRFLGAGLALGAVWTVPLMAFLAIGWGLWSVGQDAVRALLGGYLRGLEWLAAGPVGAI